MINKLKSIIILFSVIAISSYFIFFNAFQLPVQIWDEALYAVNSIEMFLNKNYFTYYYIFEPTTYNVKPPLVIWLQVFSIKVFGINETAVRIPSLLTGIGICLMLFYFIAKLFNKTAAFVVLLFLLSCFGFNRPHVIRTADLDGMLLFFTTAYTLWWMYLLFLKKHIQNKDWIILSCIILGGFFSKSFAAFIPLSGLLFATIITGYYKIFLNLKLYISALVIIVFIAVYYLFTFYNNAEVIKLVYTSEIVRLVKDIMPWHQQPWYYYFQNLYDKNFGYYTYILLLYPLAFKFADSLQKKILLFLLVYSISILLFLIIPPTKIASYDASVYPFLAMLAGIIFYIITNKLISSISFERRVHTVSLILVLAVLFTYKSFKINLKIYADTNPKDEFEFTGHVINQFTLLFPQIQSYKVFMPVKFKEHKTQAWFYMLKHNQKGYHIQFTDSISPQEGRLFLISNTLKDSIRLEHKVIAQQYGNHLIELKFK